MKDGGVVDSSSNKEDLTDSIFQRFPSEGPSVFGNLRLNNVTQFQEYIIGIYGL